MNREQRAQKAERKVARGGEAARIEIARVFRESLRLESLPEYRDGERLLEHAVAAMVRLTQSETGSVALNAAQWLVGYANTVGSRGAEGSIDVVSELRELYRKALPEGSGGGEPLVEAELEAEVRPAHKKPS